MHYYIINHREMYGLPRKFNIAFDGGGAISSLEDTNDIGFHAVRLTKSNDAGNAGDVLFQLALGGITGHRDFARDTGVVAKPEECVELAAAIVRVFIANGDRTDRKKARLKYVLDAWGFDKFLAETEKELGRPLRRVPSDDFEPRRPDDRHAHVGVHPQRQPGLQLHRRRAPRRPNPVGAVARAGRRRRIVRQRRHPTHALAESADCQHSRRARRGSQSRGSKRWASIGGPAVRVPG